MTPAGRTVVTPAAFAGASTSYRYANLEELVVSIVSRALVALAVGFVVFLFVFPFSGIDTQPPTHYNLFDQEIPFGSPWPGAAIAVLTVIGIFAATRFIRHTAQPRTGSA